VSCLALDMDVTSKYTTAKSVLKFRSETKISGSGKEEDVIVDAMMERELVKTVNTRVPHYFYMYASVINNLNLWLPFTSSSSPSYKPLMLPPHNSTQIVEPS
jgi:hypothetical protein